MQRMNDAARGNLTQSQFLVWMGQKLNADAPLYNMIVTFEFEGALDAPAFCAAFQRVVDGTDVLRTLIEERDGIPHQVVLPAMQSDMPCIDFTGEINPEQAARAWIDRQRLCLFDLGKRLFDSALLKLSPTRHIWYLSQHHLITDGWSVLVVYQRQAAMVEALSTNGDVATVQGAWPQFAGYAAHEAALRQTPALDKAYTFWDARSSPAGQPLEFFGKSNPGHAARTERLVCNLGRERTAALRAIAREKGFATLSADLSLYNIYATLMAAFLRRETDADDVRIGVPFHNRPAPTHKATAGMFIEIGPLQMQLRDEDTFASLHRKAAGDMLLALRHALPGISTAQRNHAYEVLLNFINVGFPPLAGMQPKVEWVHAGYGDRNHALRLQIHDFGNTGSDHLLFDFNVEIFDAQQREWIVQHFLQVVDAFITDRHQRIDAISLQTPAEHAQLVRAFNQTDTHCPFDKTVIALFDVQAHAQPNTVAVEHAGLALTYAELRRRSYQIAHHLHAKGARAGDIVILRMAHGVEEIAAILGVLRAGCAYAPIDPAYPIERLQFMLDDIAAAGKAAFVITQPALNGATSANTIVLDSTFNGVNDAPDSPVNLAAPHELAYVIYTSGSTGQPKGVMISHRNLLNYIHWAGRQYSDDEQLVWALFTSLSFDLTVTTVFTPLITGGRIVAYRDDANAPGSALLKIIDDNRCDVVKLTPSHLSMIHEMDMRNSRIRRFIVGGEDFKTSLALAITRAFGKPIDLCNEYGPTEATVGCMIYRFNAEHDRGLSVPIGTPAANTKIFVLDAHLNPVPAGVTGEMHIAGDGLAQGYFNRDALTHERFITVEDARLNNSGVPLRLYRTGDLARWDAHGNLEFLGRADQQVKIAGVRMELGEIEARLLSHPAVRECAVMLVKPALTPAPSTQYCSRCGLESNYPGVQYDNAGVCNFCRSFEHYKDRAMGYFKTMGEFNAIAEKMKAERRGRHDCVVLLSGGKDSTYMLYQLVGLGLNPLTFTLDNGFISDEAKANIRRVTTALGVEHVFGQTPAMNTIFVDSLKRFANVCNGCFKTIYSLATQLARERGIGTIVTGLSRGQFFETRLSEDVFATPGFDADAIDEAILAARKAYHRREDVVSRSLDVDLFREDALFDDVQFVDFYRYCTVSLDEMYAFLREHAPWIRPSDTGRSTNCLINEAGIFVHKKLRGFHNYALPYSWDVRLGHKGRAEALEELDDDIDEARVRRILREIDFDDPRLSEAPAERLVAYFTADACVQPSELQAHLLKQLPANAVPAAFVQLKAMPLTPNGKIDRKALPAIETKPAETDAAYAAPRNDTERVLAEIWARALRMERVGIHDNFFALSGDSIIAIQIIARANQAGLKLAPNQLFQQPTIAELASVVTCSDAPREAPAAIQGRASEDELNSVFAEFAE